MKNKKGFLLGEETLKIVIAVICIVFLIFLLFELYYSMAAKEKIKQALASKDKIILEIERINNGEEPQMIHVPNPSGWYIFGFTEGEKPNLCTGVNCLCICDKVLIDVFDRQIKECDSNGACIIVSNLQQFDEIKIEKSGVNLFISIVNNEIQIRK